MCEAEKNAKYDGRVDIQQMRVQFPRLNLICLVSRSVGCGLGAESSIPRPPQET